MERLTRSLVTTAGGLGGKAPAFGGPPGGGGGGGGGGPAPPKPGIGGGGGGPGMLLTVWGRLQVAACV